MAAQAQTGTYILGDNTDERQRPRTRQNAALGAEAEDLFDALPIEPGWRVVEIGCGPCGLLETMSRRVGPNGRVIGLDASSAMVEEARAFVEEQGLTNVEVLHADGRSTGLPIEGFDLVHERLVLINVAQPEEIVAEMARLARPGGLVLLQEVDHVSWQCEPPHDAWTQLLRTFHAVARDNGADPLIGRRTPGMLRRAGLLGVDVRVHVQSWHHTHPWRFLLIEFANLVRAAAAARGHLADEETAALQAGLRDHLSDPETLVIGALLFQAWGRKGTGV